VDLQNFKKFQEMIGKRLMAIDFGTKTAGVALFAPGKEPFPLPWGRIEHKGEDELIERIIAIAKDEDVDELILGLPLYKDGNPSDMTRKVQAFGERLAQKSQMPLHYQDETLSTFEAGERMKASPRYGFKIVHEEIDALSAAIILEDFLRSI
jgi:putative Holliday junction resolvase